MSDKSLDGWTIETWIQKSFYRHHKQASYDYVLFLFFIISLGFVTGTTTSLQIHNQPNILNLSALVPLSLKSTYMDCTKDSDCNSPMMYCNHKVNTSVPFCDCGIFHIWSEEIGNCVGLVNTSCARGRRCATNSYCDEEDWCKCNPTHSVGRATRECYLKYDSVCEPNARLSGDICNFEQHLICNHMTRRCGCKYDQQMQWDNEAGECRMLIDEPCDPFPSIYYKERKLPQHRCIEGATCQLKELDDSIGRCYWPTHKIQNPTKDGPIELDMLNTSNTLDLTEVTTSTLSISFPLVTSVVGNEVIDINFNENKSVISITPVSQTMVNITTPAHRYYKRIRKVKKRLLLKRGALSSGSSALSFLNVFVLLIILAELGYSAHLISIINDFI